MPDGIAGDGPVRVRSLEAMYCNGRRAQNFARTSPSGRRNLTGARVPVGRSTVLGRRLGYQAWALPQCGQSTEVDTSALKTNPHAQV